MNPLYRYITEGRVEAGRPTTVTHARRRESGWGESGRQGAVGQLDPLSASLCGWPFSPEAWSMPFSPTQLQEVVMILFLLSLLRGRVGLGEAVS
jgi:hypothetical protein